MIRVCIVGLGNCASALVQGVHYYSDPSKKSDGLISEKIGDYAVSDISFVLGFDVDQRKIDLPIREAIFQKPNCCSSLSPKVQKDTSGRFNGIVFKGPLLDGVSEHMRGTELDSERFYVDDTYESSSEELILHLMKAHGVTVLVNYLPVGSEKATEFWANICLKASLNMVNCIPVFIASTPEWSYKFKEAKLALIGDDMKSQFGASIVSQMFQELALSRGHKVKMHIQQNSGGNTDFLNMINSDRLKSKKISKENVLKLSGQEPEYCHAGPSDYIRIFGDTKVATFHLELEGFCGAPVKLDARLEVQDSPNSAGIVIDALRYVTSARDRGLYGALEGPSAFTQKSPPIHLSYQDAVKECALYK